MKMDPSKKLGIIKEQIGLENISRRRYPDKWGELTSQDINAFYNQNAVNAIIRDTLSDPEEKNPYEYTGHGDSYFLSKEMYESLVAKCRCGRPRTEGHVLKCLQKVTSKYFSRDDEVQTEKIYESYREENLEDNNWEPLIGNRRRRRRNANKRVPETSNGIIGWSRADYMKLDHSTKYISPIATMHGPKITENPYQVIFIG